jgi:hypothetical protein
MTPTSLGAVKVGMTLPEAEVAAGAPLRPFPDSGSITSQEGECLQAFFSYTTKKVTGFVALQFRSACPEITTTGGLRIGSTVGQLLAVYGKRAKFYASKPSMSPSPGYVVSDSDGQLSFLVLKGVIVGIATGNESSCGCTP